jgi:hypothetical protein
MKRVTDPCFRMKALLFTLIRAFEFDLAVPAEAIQKKASGLVQKPVLATATGFVNQMPLLIKSYNRT